MEMVSILQSNWTVSRSATLPLPMTLLSTRGWMEMVISARTLPHFVVVSYLLLFKSLSPSSFSLLLHSSAFVRLSTLYCICIDTRYLEQTPDKNRQNDLHRSHRVYPLPICRYGRCSDITHLRRHWLHEFPFHDSK